MATTGDRDEDDGRGTGDVVGIPAPDTGRANRGGPAPPAQGDDLGYLVEWWTVEAGSTEPVGRWAEEPDAGSARARAGSVAADALSGRVRVSIARGDETVAAVVAGLAELDAWGSDSPLPEPSPGPPLPPRSADDVRSEVLRACRDAMALAIRARMLTRERVVDLLHGIAVAFDPGMRDGEDAR